MNRADRQKLDEYFAKARIEPPVTTEDEILSLLDDGGAPGRQPLPVGSHAETSHNRFRGTTMKVIALTVIATSLGSAAIYFNAQQPEPAIVPAIRHHDQNAMPQQAAAPQHSTTSPSSLQSLSSLKEKATTAEHAPATTQKTEGTMPLPKKVDGMNAPESKVQATVDQQVMNVPENSHKELDSALTRELGQMLSTYAAEYWVEKINGYRVRIDRMLSETDRTELGRLRVRWDIAMADEDEDEGSGMKMNFSVGDKKKQEPDNNDGRHGSIALSLGAGTRHDGTHDLSTSTNVNGEEVDPQAAMQMVMSMMVANGDERAIIIRSVKDMAVNYRPQLDGLKEMVLSDIASFMTSTGDRVEHFISEHRSDFSAELIDSVSSNLDKVRQGVTSDEIRNAIGMLYDFIGEPLLMLYNGADVGGLVPASIAAPVPGMKMGESNALRQSTPNPASTQATIGYVLNEPSSATTLRLYDASGRVVATVDQGAQPAGERSATFDVSTLAPGTYLYHLTIQTSKGEQVFSKTLQVAR